ncbi:MAG: type II secretion system protein [Planctomycetes bacterium]|nr:type II secretion system protein [Planctomycetota bacterium]
MKTVNLSRNSRRGFTLVELLVGMVVSTILIMGMGIVMVTLFTGMRESKDFANATGRVDLIRQLTFDARTGNDIIFPATDGTTGYYVGTGYTGHQIQFNSLRYDPVGDTTSDVTITWESRIPNATPTDPFIVYRFVDETPEDPPVPGDDVMTFAQDDITTFTILRNSTTSFSAAITTTENSEVVAVELAVTLRNVIN